MHRLLASLAYHDYVAMIISCDAEWSRCSCNSPMAAHLAVQKQIDDACREYKTGAKANYDLFREALRHADPSALSDRTRYPDDFAEYLFNPIHYVPFGRPDSLTFVLMDDFDPIRHITSRIHTTIEEICLAFFPKTESLGIPPEETLFSSMADIQCERSPFQGRSSPHPIQQRDDLPLVVFTKYKMDGFLSLGFAFLAQQAIFRAMAQRMRLVRDALLANAEARSPLMQEDDLRSMKCVFFDLQGPEELGTAIFCRNYSAAMSLVSAARSITYHDVFAEDVEGQLASAIGESDAHNNVLEIMARQLQSKSRMSIKDLGDNHAFRWTHSELAVSNPLFLSADAGSCGGILEVQTQLQIESGHHASVEARVRRAPENNARQIPSQKIHEGGHWARYHAGVADLVVPVAEHLNESQLPFVSLASALGVLRENVKEFGPHPDGYHSRDVVDLVTSINVPLPRLRLQDRELIVGHVGNKHCSPLDLVLPLMQKALCFPDTFHIPTSPAGQRTGRLNYEQLMRMPRMYRLPVELRRTFETLFKTFATLIADPYLFDSVLDLYDAFATLHRVLTYHLLIQRRAELAKPDRFPFALLDDSRVAQLAGLADALHNALSHRIAKAYPAAQARDVGTDLLGGLNQIILAAGAAQTCGLGLLRKYVMSSSPSNSARNTVGVLTRITFLPGTSTHSLDLKTEENACLAWIEVDVPHILHPSTYCDYIHECAHLIFRSIDARQESFRRRNRLPSHTFERLGEIFANLVTLGVLYGHDSETFLRHHMVNYTKLQNAKDATEENLILQLSELFIRLFIAADTIPSVRVPRALWIEQPWKRRHSSVRTVLAAFEQALDSVAPLLPDYDRLWKGRDAAGRCLCRDRFLTTFNDLYLHLEELWRDAATIISRYCREDLGGETSDERQRELRVIAAKAMREGRPLIRCAMQPPVMAIKPPEFGVDPLELLCALLHEHTGHISECMGREIHICREADGNVKYPFGEKWRRWHEFQVDPGAAAYFCPVPSSRRERLCRDIVILKTCWDIAANLRSRRLAEIIHDNWDLAIC